METDTELEMRGKTPPSKMSLQIKIKDIEKQGEKEN